LKYFLNLKFRFSLRCFGGIRGELAFAVSAGVLRKMFQAIVSNSYLLYVFDHFYDYKKNISIGLNLNWNADSYLISQIFNGSSVRELLRVWIRNFTLLRKGLGHLRKDFLDFSFSDRIFCFRISSIS
jgi:hypothetical protein